MKKNKHLLVQIGIRVTVFFLLICTLLGSVIFWGCGRLYLTGKEEMLDKELIHIQNDITPAVFPALFEYWRENCDSLPAELNEEQWEMVYDYIADVETINDEAFREFPDDVKLYYSKMCYDSMVSTVSYDISTFQLYGLSVVDVSEEYGGFIYTMGIENPELSENAFGEQYPYVDDTMMESIRSCELNETQYGQYYFTKDPSNVENIYVGCIPLFQNEDGTQVAVFLEYNWTEFRKQLVRNTLVLIGTCLLDMLIAGTALLLYLRRVAINPVVQIQKSVREFMTTRDSKQVVSELQTIRAKNEFGVLSDDVAQLSTEISNYITELEQSKETIRVLTTEVMDALAHTIDAKDSYTNGHSHRVAIYSRMLARNLGLSAKEQNKVYCMGLLHDIGKIGVPGSIINKTTRLTDEEYEIIKSHSVLGYEILDEIQSFPELAQAARWHHELYDGSGYPDKKSGEEIPLLVRIIAVADSYDAMTSNRSYRKYLPQDVVRAEIEKNIGKQFDPEVAACMLKIIDADKNYALHE
ncbi:MAG: HD-GYP domain-containing protein [Oscillospiraceae bacterium]|nr:HD-GYP domain-containing protein [Oscillospiraceae bacterium]